MALTLSSPAFREGDRIPSKYTCMGADVSPPLQWSAPPKGTQSLALIADDPDAPMGTWVHWVLFNIPPSEQGLPEGLPTKDVLPNGAKQGINDFKRIGYGGPCPPPGKPHRYYFTLYALDTMLRLPARATKAQVLEAAQGHVLAKAQLMGQFAR
ncbi:MAG: YbhB/YbcL family Raf kinase inhibitor-like protein [Nitrospirae bacterium]|nr:MAG: YbhB/YbcL family Raf kinase inhibitor-like protein [Nitrospirota bacterium]